MIKIVKMLKEHIDEVFKIEQECFSSPWSKEDLEKQLCLDTSHFVVALLNGRVVGYMGLQIFSGEGYVTNVAVLPDFRRRGIARALIDECFKYEMDFITLEVRESNASAIRLYENAGFKKIGIRPKFYSNPAENAIIMTRYFNDIY